MRFIIVLAALASSLLSAAELPMDASALAKTVCESFDISISKGIASLNHASSIIKKKINIDESFMLFSKLEHDLWLLRPHTAEQAKAVSQAHNCAMNYFQEESRPFAGWHTITTELITHAQKKNYPLYSVMCITLALDRHNIKTGWRYTIFTNEETELDPLKQKITRFGMSMDMNDFDHWRTQFVIAPLKKNGNGNQLINNI